MNFILPILFATIAAAGNALFAYGQKQSSGVSNGLLYVGASALVACLLALSASPAVGPANSRAFVKTGGSSPSAASGCS